MTDLVARASSKGGRGSIYFAVEASGTLARRDIDRSFFASNAIHAVYQVDAVPVAVGYRIHPADQLYADQVGARTIILEEEDL